MAEAQCTGVAARAGGMGMVRSVDTVCRTVAESEREPDTPPLTPSSTRLCTRASPGRVVEVKCRGTVMVPSRAGV